MSCNYSSSIPENLKASYTEYDTVDFVLTFENKALELNSLRIEGDLKVRNNNLPLDDVSNLGADIKYDRMVGAHSFIESIQTEMLGSVFENITEYPRMIKQTQVARNTQMEAFNSSQMCELKVPTDDMAKALLEGEKPFDSSTVNIRVDPDFSIKPRMLLNSNVGYIPYNKTGPIRVSVNLARAMGCLYGVDCSATTTTYTIENMRLSYRTTDDMTQVSKEPVVLRKRINIKSSIQSSLSNVQVKVPSQTVESFTGSFQEQSHENTAFWNNLSLDKVPNLTETQFMFNDSTNQYVSFVLRSNVEVIDKFLESIGKSGKNSVDRTNMNSNDGYGIGLKMNELVDLSQQKFSVQLNSDISSGNPFIMYMYFTSVLEF